MGQVTSPDGTIIAFEQTGDGPLVILVDGTMAYRGHMGSLPLAAALSQGFTVIAYDRRGRGDSTDVQPYAVEREIEDIAALAQVVGGPVCLYGHSSGAVLALRAAASLGDLVVRLALYEPPFSIQDGTEQAFANYRRRINDLLEAGKRDEAVAFFLSDMVPPGMLEDMRRSPEWALMEAVAHTLAYDNAVMRQGTLPEVDARAVTTPTLVLDGSETMSFLSDAADALASVMRDALRQTLPGQSHWPPAPEVLAPVLAGFFTIS